MKIEPTGIVMVDVCSIQTEKCVAKQVAPITAVWTLPARVQVNVCRPCLEEQVRSGEWQIEGAKVARRVDVAVYSARKQLVLAVEVKKEPRTKVPSKEWATQIHRNLLSHAGVPSAPYFLLAVPPESLYLWVNSGSPAYSRPPDFEANVKDLLAPYYNKLSSLLHKVNEYYYLELVVSSWLKDLVRSEPQLEDRLPWLYKSGLYAAIKDGTVVMQSALAA